MTNEKKSRNALDGPIIEVRSGVAIYKVHASPFYKARIWFPSEKKRRVFSTKATSRIEAIKRAEELFASLGSQGKLNGVPQEHTFKRFAQKSIDTEKRNGERGEIHPRTWKVSKAYLHNPKWGLLKYFGEHDVTKIQGKDYLAYRTWMDEQGRTLSAGTRNHIANTFRKVMNLAKDEGVIAILPEMPKHKRKDNPRPFFQFYPRVSRDEDELNLIRQTALDMESEGVTVRGTPVTKELYHFINFMIRSFMRPTESEVYALRHRQVTVAERPQRLIITINGKTGLRTIHSMPLCVETYRAIQELYPDHKRDDFVFLPGYERAYALRTVERQFNELLSRCNLKIDSRFSGLPHTVYSLRHTAICSRLVRSEGKVNVYTLAKNCGTSVDQIERFYAKYLGLDIGMVRNLQHVGDDFIGMSDEWI